MHSLYIRLPELCSSVYRFRTPDTPIKTDEKNTWEIFCLITELKINCIYLYIAQMRRIKKESKCKNQVFQNPFFSLVHRLDETLSGSSKISSRLCAALFLAGVTLDFDTLEDVFDESPKISSEQKDISD